MSDTSSTVARKDKKQIAKSPSCLTIARSGIQTSQDFAALMSCLMSDLIEGNVNPVVGNAVCNAGAKLLKVVEMQYRYGNGDGTREKNLHLATLPGKALKQVNATEGE